MPDIAATKGASANRSSKNTTPTGRSSGTASNSSTNTPSSRKKKTGGDQHESGGGGIAGLFASLCGGSKAKKAFDDRESSAGRNTTAKPATTVRRPSQSKASPAAPITTKEIAPDVEVSTTKRLSTTETGPFSGEEGIHSSATGDSNRGAMAGGDPTRTARAENLNGDTPSAIPRYTSDKLQSGRQILSGEDSGFDQFTHPVGSKSVAPVILGTGAVGLGATSILGLHNGISGELPTEIGEASRLPDRSNVEAVAHQFDKDMGFNETLVSTGHPLPYDETEGLTSAAVQPPGSGPIFVPASGPHAHHHHLTPHITPSGTPAPSTPSRSQSHPSSDSNTHGDVDREALDMSLLSATEKEDERAIIPGSLTAPDGVVGLGINADTLGGSSPIHSVPSKEDSEHDDDGQYDESNIYADGLEADEEFMDEEDRLIRQGGIGIPLGPDGKPAPLLPPIAPEHVGRKCLVLDLDETLLHSSFKTMPSADFIVPVEIESQTHNVYVIKRPGVDMFLKAMGEIYEVVVFTASLSKYADPVLDMLDIHKVVKHRLFRESCYNHKGNYVKDLSQLGRDIHTSIILDNSPASYIFHPNNAVPVSTWFNDPHDTELTDLCPFLTDLAPVADVRGVLDGQL